MSIDHCTAEHAGTTLGSPLLQELIDAAYGYRWNYLDKCIIDEGYFAGGFCR